MSAAATQFIDIPIGTRSGRCRSCGQTIYWVRMPRGNMMPVSIAADGCRAPDAFSKGQLDVFDGKPRDPQPGRGISHFADCPDADKWRGGNH